MRDFGLSAGTIIVTECTYFQRYIKNIENQKVVTIYPQGYKQSIPQLINRRISETNLIFCYIGTVNKIVDFKSIDQLFNKVTTSKKIKLHFIGTGEGKRILEQLTVKYNGEFIDHGIVYDDIKKATILNECHFGLNLFKSEVIVGLSLKSVEYLRFGIPMISNLSGDTAEWLKKNSILGFNFKPEMEISSIINFYNQQSLDNIRTTIQLFFKEYFTEEKLMEEWKTIFNELT